MTKSLVMLSMFFIILLPISFAQEVIGQITVTEDITDSGAIDLEKTGETMPDTSSDQPSSNEGRPGGGGGGGGISITNIYNITNIIKESEEEESKETGEDEEEREKTTPSQEEIKPKAKGLAAITGAAIGNFIDGLSRGSPLVGVIILLCIVIAGLVGYIYGYRKK